MIPPTMRMYDKSLLRFRQRREQRNKVMQHLGVKAFFLPTKYKKVDRKVLLLHGNGIKIKKCAERKLKGYILPLKKSLREINVH